MRSAPEIVGRGARSAARSSRGRVKCARPQDGRLKWRRWLLVCVGAALGPRTNICQPVVGAVGWLWKVVKAARRANRARDAELAKPNARSRECTQAARDSRLSAEVARRNQFRSILAPLVDSGAAASAGASRRAPPRAAKSALIGVHRGPRLANTTCDANSSASICLSALAVNRCSRASRRRRAAPGPTLAPLARPASSG